MVTGADGQTYLASGGDQRDRSPPRVTPPPSSSLALSLSLWADLPCTNRIAPPRSQIAPHCRAAHGPTRTASLPANLAPPLRVPRAPSRTAPRTVCGLARHDALTPARHDACTPDAQGGPRRPPHLDPLEEGRPSTAPGDYDGRYDENDRPGSAMNDSLRPGSTEAGMSAAGTVTPGMLRQVREWREWPWVERACVWLRVSA